MRKLILGALLLLSTISFGQNHIVISQVNPGGGLGSYRYDYVELYNPTSSSINLVGLSLQYQTANSNSWQIITNLSGIIGPGKYYLVNCQDGMIGNYIAADKTNLTINLSYLGGKIALCNTTTLLANCNSSNIIDKLGYGNTSILCNESSNFQSPGQDQALFRLDDGCSDTDNNSLDFYLNTPFPRNSNSPSHLCPSINYYNYHGYCNLISVAKNNQSSNNNLLNTYSLKELSNNVNDFLYDTINHTYNIPQVNDYLTNSDLTGFLNTYNNSTSLIGKSISSNEISIIRLNGYTHYLQNPNVYSDAVVASSIDISQYINSVGNQGYTSGSNGIYYHQTVNNQWQFIQIYDIDTIQFRHLEIFDSQLYASSDKGIFKIGDGLPNQTVSNITNIISYANSDIYGFSIHDSIIYIADNGGINPSTRGIKKFKLNNNIYIEQYHYNAYCKGLAVDYSSQYPKIYSTSSLISPNITNIILSLQDNNTSLTEIENRDYFQLPNGVNYAGIDFTSNSFSENQINGNNIYINEIETCSNNLIPFSFTAINIYDGIELPINLDTLKTSTGALYECQWIKIVNNDTIPVTNISYNPNKE
jgi:hypothetical protein